jgi:DNA-binding response OmpR family regulator
MKPRVLVVDDSFSVRMDLRAALSTAGFTVTACGTKEGALRALKLSPFNLAILDINLPDGSGIDILQEIKQTTELQSIRVFMLSSEDEVNSRIRGLRLGADLYVGKPYDKGYVARAARDLFKMSDYSGAPTSRRSLSNKNVLIVDDSPTFLSALASALRTDGHQVVMADSGQDALALVEVERFDCVLVDLVMPGMDGMQTCTQLRAMPRLAQVPIALMTSKPHHSLSAQAAAAGIDDVLSKGGDLALMSKALRELLLRKTQQQGSADKTVRSAGIAERLAGGYTGTLYSQVIPLTGLSPLVSKSVVDRALQRVGVIPAGLTHPELRQALPHIAEALRTFLAPAELERRVADITQLCDNASLPTLSTTRRVRIPSQAPD